MTSGLVLIFSLVGILSLCMALFNDSRWLFALSIMSICWLILSFLLSCFTIDETEKVLLGWLLVARGSGGPMYCVSSCRAVMLS